MSADQRTRVVGVLGGGQLGRMLAEAASPLDISLRCLDPKGSVCPMGKSLPEQHCLSGALDREADVKRLAKLCEVVTFEVEHVYVDFMSSTDTTTMPTAADTASECTVEGARVEPHPRTLSLIQDKWRQKVHLIQHGVPVMASASLSGSNRQAVAAALESFAASHGGWPVMLKRRRLAYDGRGNWVVRSAQDVSEALDALLPPDDQTTADAATALYVEQWAPFRQELAVMVAQGRDGRPRLAYPCVETIQSNSICHQVLCPARVEPRVAEQARELALQAVQCFRGAGVYGVEFFLLENGQLVVNEIAPRPHNSGHYSIEACHTSQFEQHLRAILGLPLGSSSLRVPAAVMINLLGLGAGEEGMRATWALAESGLSLPGVSLHWYGKTECRPGRKMGHLTLVGDRLADLLVRADSLSKSFEVAHPTQSPALSPFPGPLVGVIMGSDSDLRVMKAAADILHEFKVPFEVTIVSAHRTPDRLVSYSRSAETRGLRCIIAGAGGAAHLPGMCASLTTLPVIGVPVALKRLDGVDSLHSIVQMPRGVPVACMGIDNATNAGLLAVRILGVQDGRLLRATQLYQDKMRDQVLDKVDKLERDGFQSAVQER